jgi:hypothetical protein
MKGHLIKFLLFCLPQLSLAQQKGFALQTVTANHQVDVRYNGRLLTSYCYYDSIMKPFLFPVNTTDGITVTRGYPITPLTGERTDHPHHTGAWLNYESVNGLDFWNNSTAIALEKRSEYGTIRHEKILTSKAAGDSAQLTVQTGWFRPDHKRLLDEQTTFYFSVKGSDFIIDRVTTLTALDTAVTFKDAKDGMFAIRVARELEMPSTEAAKFVDNKGNITTVPQGDNRSVTGMYQSSEGLKGDAVWSSRARWVKLTGIKQGKEITIAMIDHPLNVNYPSYWHARGYGLFAVNPLGEKIFSNGARELNYSIRPHRSVTFRYRIVIRSGQAMSDTEVDKYAKEFGGNKH